MDNVVIDLIEKYLYGIIDYDELRDISGLSNDDIVLLIDVYFPEFDTDFE